MIEERSRPKTDWLIVRDGSSGLREVLTLKVGGEEALPVFSFEEEALLYLNFSGLTRDWRASKSGIADLFSVLADPWLGVRRVALDPFPEIGLHGLHDLVSLPREEFVEILVARQGKGGEGFGRTGRGNGEDRKFLKCDEPSADGPSGEGSTRVPDGGPRPNRASTGTPNRSGS